MTPQRLDLIDHRRSSPRSSRYPPLCVPSSPIPLVPFHLSMLPSSTVPFLLRPCPCLFPLGAPCFHVLSASGTRLSAFSGGACASARGTSMDTRDVTASTGTKAQTHSRSPSPFSPLRPLRQAARPRRPAPRAAAPPGSRPASPGAAPRRPAARARSPPAASPAAGRSWPSARAAPLRRASC